MGQQEQRGEKSHGHEEGVHHQRPGQAAEFADNEFPAPYRARKDGVEGFLLHFLRYQPDADEDGDHHPEDGDGRQPQVDQHDALDADGDLTEQQRRAHQQQGKEDQVVEDAVAHGLTEGVRCYGGNTIHSMTMTT